MYVVQNVDINMDNKIIKLAFHAYLNNNKFIIKLHVYKAINYYNKFISIRM